MYELRILRKYPKDMPNEHVDVLQYRTRTLDYDDGHGEYVFSAWSKWKDVPVVKEKE